MIPRPAQPPADDRLRGYRPYPKQAEFHAAGAAHRERLFMAGNQLGKTLAGAMEEAIPCDRPLSRLVAGPVLSRADDMWAAGVTGESTRDTVQRLLLGRAGEPGTGALPWDAVVKTIPARGVAGLIDTILVRHVSGGVSRIALKSYEKGREKWQGETLDRVWFDEEPPGEVYSEGLTRTNATGGFVCLTFTPLEPWQRLARYANLIQGNYGGTSTSTVTGTPARASIGAGMLGGAASGALAGTTIMPGWGTLLGAGVGALGGLLSR